MNLTLDHDLDAALDRVGRNADTIEYAETIMRNRAWFRAHPPKSIDAAVWEWAFVRRMTVEVFRPIDVDEVRYVVRNRDFPARYETFVFGFWDLVELGRVELTVRFSDEMRDAERRLHPPAFPA